MVDYVTVVCGKQFILDMWLKYILSLPTHKYPGNLIVVNNTDVDNHEYNSRLYRELHDVRFLKKFETVNIISGPGTAKISGSKTWRHPSVSKSKHDSTAAAFTIGFSRCFNEYTVTIDDDTFIVDDGLLKLMDTIESDKKIGGVSGLYLAKDFTGREFKVQNRTHLDREMLISLDQNVWTALDISEIYNTGIREIGFGGTGAAVWITQAVKKQLPLYTSVSPSGWDQGPDANLWKDLRNSGHKVLVETSVLATHWNKSSTDDPVEVGVGVNYIKHSHKDNGMNVLLTCSWGDLEQRNKTLKAADKLARELNCKKICMFWPGNIDNKFDVQSLRMENKMKTSLEIVPVDVEVLGADAVNVPRYGSEGRLRSLLRQYMWEYVTNNRYKKAYAAMAAWLRKETPTIKIECLMHHPEILMDRYRIDSWGIVVT